MSWSSTTTARLYGRSAVVSRDDDVVDHTLESSTRRGRRRQSWSIHRGDEEPASDPAPLGSLVRTLSGRGTSPDSGPRDSDRAGPTWLRGSRGECSSRGTSVPRRRAEAGGLVQGAPSDWNTTSPSQSRPSVSRSSSCPAQLWSRRHPVEVVHTQEKRGIRRPGEQPRHQRRAQIAEVQRPRWAGHEPADRHDERHHGLRSRSVGVPLASAATARRVVPRPHHKGADVSREENSVGYRNSEVLQIQRRASASFHVNKAAMSSFIIQTSRVRATGPSKRASASSSTWHPAARARRPKTSA